ncbi:MAG TPA: glycosyltransferase [Tepidisphaeraceae bacterium]|nr:glycosyltransferase [Tepidisphaeraceae bacterium]
MKVSRVILVDGNPPWVRSLMLAVAATGVEVESLRPHMISKSTPIEKIDQPRFHQSQLALPGWSKFGWLSTRIVARRVRRMGAADAVLYTLPQYAGVAEMIRGPVCAYFAHDPFKFYDWNVETTQRLEQRMLDRCDVVFAISEALSQDFRKITKTPVETLRNAVSRSFIDRLRTPPPVPADLAAIGRPVIGCVGQISENAYDWDLIAALAEKLPRAWFVFVGPVFSQTPTIKQIMAMPNVRWLGAKPHDQLPAYLNGFDVCFNPLRPGEHSDRRSPLRLYDYLATNKPILSTAIGEAYGHRPLIEIGQSADECARLILKMTDGDYSIDLEARRRYIEENTWENRARELLRRLETCRP